MFFIDLLFALIVGFLLTILFAFLFDARGPWDILWAFLLIVVLGAWVGGLWLVPFGPVMFEVAWIPFLLAGLFFALILAAATPPSTTASPKSVTPTESQAAFAFSVFFWILLVGLMVAIILAYI